MSRNIYFVSYSSKNAVHGVSARFSRPVRDVFSNTSHNRWIGKAGPTTWPPRKSDLNPLNFYLWERLKSLVYAIPVDNGEALHHRICGCLSD
jgi:hypothetical protein